MTNTDSIRFRATDSVATGNAVTTFGARSVPACVSVVGVVATDPTGRVVGVVVLQPHRLTASPVWSVVRCHTEQVVAADQMLAAVGGFYPGVIRNRGVDVGAAQPAGGRAA